MPSKTWFLSFSWPSLCSDFSDFNFLVTVLGSHYVIMIPRWVHSTLSLHLRTQREGCLQETPSEVLGSLFSRSPQLTYPLLHWTLASDMVISLALVTGSSQEPRLDLVFPKTPCVCVCVCVRYGTSMKIRILLRVKQMDKERKQSLWKKTKPLISQSLGLLEELSMELDSCYMAWSGNMDVRV